MPTQPGLRSLLHAPHDLVQLVAGGRCGRVKHHPRFRLAGEHAIENDDVKVHMEIDRRPIPLHEIYRAALRVLEPAALRTRGVAGEDRLDDDAPERREHVGLEGREPSQLEGQGEDVLTNGNVRENPVHNGGARVCHAPSGAAGTRRP